MGDVKAWILGICFAGLACAVLDMVYPSGNMEKSIKLVTAVFFLCALVVPAAGRLSHIDWELTKETSAAVTASPDLEEALNRQVLRASEYNLETAIKRLLEQQFQIAPQEISVTMDTRDNGSIEMKCIEILLEEKDKGMQEELKKYVQQQVGMTPEIYVV